MNKIFLIIQREYVTRVKKKSFIIMTLITPLLMAAVFVVPVIIAKSSDDNTRIQVIDEAGLEFKNSAKMTFEKYPMTFEDAKAVFSPDEFYAILYVPKEILTDGSGVVLYAKKDVSLSVKERISNQIEQQLYNTKLADRGIDRALLDSLKSDIRIKTVKATETGEESTSSEAATIAGFAGGFLIYFFIFLYGMQVMRGVMEEKTSRIVEVIISSVKPFQLMMGKIIGVALVGLTQFLLWVVLTFGITTIAMTFVFSKKEVSSISKEISEQNSSSVYMQSPSGKQMMADDGAKEEIAGIIKNINFTFLISIFIFYFLGGYLLYSALFAAVGAAVDHDSDTQQFMLPITIPLVLAFVIAQSVVTTNPDSAIAFWFSIIPFTSPIVMMVRLPFGVPTWELILSMVLLVVGFVFTTWLASKIYRTGILMYGKKVSYKELAKWLFYKE